MCDKITCNFKYTCLLNIDGFCASDLDGIQPNNFRCERMVIRGNDMNNYYLQKSQEIFPIYGVTSMEEAKQFVDEKDHGRIVETKENVYMNVATGSIDFASGWDDLSKVVKVEYDVDSGSWIEVK